MAHIDQEVEDRIIQAKKALEERKKLSVAQAAVEFNVDYDRLRQRLKSNGGKNKTLNQEQTIELYSFLDRQINIGNQTTKDMIESAAQRILKVSGSDHEMGKAW
jgi:hypothetical protein